MRELVIQTIVNNWMNGLDGFHFVFALDGDLNNPQYKEYSKIDDAVYSGSSRKDLKDIFITMIKSCSDNILLMVLEDQHCDKYR